MELTATYDTRMNGIAMLSTAKIGDFVTFEEEKRKYEIQARSDRYLVCTKPFHARRTVIYTVVDLTDQVRGTENLVFGAGAETREQCQEMIERLEGRDSELGFQTEVSHRNRIRLNVKTIWKNDQPASASAA